MVVISVCHQTGSALVQSGERSYACPIIEDNGETKFKFKGEWHKVEDYAFEYTLYN